MNSESDITSTNSLSGAASAPEMMTAASNIPDKNVSLTTVDGQVYEVSMKVAMYSNLIKTAIGEDLEGDHDIPLPNVKAAILSKPLKSNVLSDFVQDWYTNFVTQAGQEVVMELILAANYLDIKPLLDLSCAFIACLIKGRTPEEIRKNFNIIPDFSPEEEAQLREENKWALDEL